MSTAAPRIGLQARHVDDGRPEVERDAGPPFADVPPHLVALEVVRPLGLLGREHARDEPRRDRGRACTRAGGFVGGLELPCGRAERPGGEPAETQERVAARQRGGPLVGVRVLVHAPIVHLHLQRSFRAGAELGEKFGWWWSGRRRPPDHHRRG